MPNTRGTSGGIGSPAICSAVNTVVASPTDWRVTSQNPAPTCVLTCRYQCPTSSAYASFTSAGTAPVAVVYTTCTARGPPANGPPSDRITPRSVWTTYAVAGSTVSAPNPYAGSTLTD